MNLGVDLNLLWAAAAGLVLGAGVVFLLLRRGGSVNRERAESLASELEETRLELESHREEVSKHFAETSDLFRDLTEQYTKLYAHLATGAREFCPDEVPSLGQGLDTPLLIDDAPPAADEASAPGGSAETPAVAASDEPGEAPAVAASDADRPEADASETSEEKDRKEAAAAEAGAGDDAGTAPAADQPAESEKERLAVEAPVPGASPPTVGSQASGGSHLTH